MKLFNSLQITDEANHLKTLISDQMNRTVECASSWLTPVPIAEHGFALHKSAFQDTLWLKYGWTK